MWLFSDTVFLLFSAVFDLEDLLKVDGTTTEAPPKVVPKVPTKAPIKPKPKPGKRMHLPVCR